MNIFPLQKKITIAARPESDIQRHFLGRQQTHGRRRFAHRDLQHQAENKEVMLNTKD